MHTSLHRQSRCNFSCIKSSTRRTNKTCLYFTTLYLRSCWKWWSWTLLHSHQYPVHRYLYQESRKNQIPGRTQQFDPYTVPNMNSEEECWNSRYFLSYLIFRSNHFSYQSYIIHICHESHDIHFTDWWALLMFCYWTISLSLLSAYQLISLSLW